MCSLKQDPTSATNYSFGMFVHGSTSIIIVILLASAYDISILMIAIPSLHPADNIRL